MIGALTYADSDWRSSVSVHVDGGDTVAPLHACMILATLPVP
jgi:hypothetical protein